MTTQEGKDLLQQCLSKCQSTADIDELIIYKTGTKKKAANYQTDTIKTNVDSLSLKSAATFVIKCFTHLELYVAWSKEIGQGNGKYIFYKKDLIAMENDSTCLFREIVINKSAKAYIFRGEDGIMKFMREHLLL